MHPVLRIQLKHEYECHSPETRVIYGSYMLLNDDPWKARLAFLQRVMLLHLSHKTEVNMMMFSMPFRHACGCYPSNHQGDTSQPLEERLEKSS